MQLLPQRAVIGYIWGTLQVTYSTRAKTRHSANSAGSAWNIHKGVTHMYGQRTCNPDSEETGRTCSLCKARHP